MQYDGLIQIWLINQKQPIETYSDSPEEVYDFFAGLESDDGDAFKGFTDMDGEYLSCQLNEIVYAMTPENLYEEGREITLSDIDL